MEFINEPVSVEVQAAQRRDRSGRWPLSGGAGATRSSRGAGRAPRRDRRAIAALLPGADGRPRDLGAVPGQRNGPVDAGAPLGQDRIATGSLLIERRSCFTGSEPSAFEPRASPKRLHVDDGSLVGALAHQLEPSCRPHPERTWPPPGHRPRHEGQLPAVDLDNSAVVEPRNRWASAPGVARPGGRRRCGSPPASR